MLSIAAGRERESHADDGGRRARRTGSRDERDRARLVGEIAHAKISIVTRAHEAPRLPLRHGGQIDHDMSATGAVSTPGPARLERLPRHLTGLGDMHVEAMHILHARTLSGSAASDGRGEYHAVWRTRAAYSSCSWRVWSVWRSSSVQSRFSCTALLPTTHAADSRPASWRLGSRSSPRFYRLRSGLWFSPGGISHGEPLQYGESLPIVGVVVVEALAIVAAAGGVIRQARRRRG